MIVILSSNTEHILHYIIGKNCFMCFKTFKNSLSFLSFANVHRESQDLIKTENNQTKIYI